MAFRKLIFIITLCTGFSQVSNAQERFYYCLGIEDSLPVRKVNEFVSGDTLIKTFFDELYGFYSPDEDPDSTFSYYFVHDSVFTKINGELSFIGHNNPEIGDIWMCRNYYNGSYFLCDDPLEPMYKALTVTEIDQVDINGVTTNYITLTYGTGINAPEYRFLANAGVTWGGPLYNYFGYNGCTYVYDGPYAFRSYFLDGESYLMEVCENTGGLFEPFVEYNIIIQDNQLTVEDLPNQSKMTLADLSGRVMKTVNDSTMDVHSLNGIYLLQIESVGHSRVIRVYIH